MREAEGKSAAVLRSEWLDRLRADQAGRWRRGECVPVEDYVAREPGLANDTEALLDLVYSEVMLREERGEVPVPEEYLRRFPAHAAEIRRQFELHEALAASSLLAPSSTQDTPPRAPGGEDAETGDGATSLPPSEGGAGRPEGETPPAAGRVAIPGYDILGELGRGGMGVVYKARQRRPNRLVAVKMILRGEHVRPEDVARFLAEAEAVAALEHPHIVKVFEVGEHAGLPFFTLDYVEGGSLAQKLRGSPLPAREAARLVETLARAVHVAHERGVVHRDLKPANILLDKDGRPKITDFGLAKRVAGDAGLTQSGAVMGTPSYMAPEQAAGKGQEVGPATDVYALGAVLYELLTGRPPFKAANALDTVFQVLHDEPVSPRRLQPKVPRDLETVCLHCLRKEAPKRYATAEALADDLKRFLNGEPIRARPAAVWQKAAKWVRRKPAAATLVGVSVLAAAVLFGVVLGFTVQLKTALKATRDERDRAERERSVAQAVNYFIQHDLLGQADIANQTPPAGRAGRNSQVTVSELLDRAAGEVGNRFPDRPEVEAAIRQTLGDAYRAQGEYAKAQGQMEPALALRRQHLGDDHPDTLTSMHNLGVLYQSRGRLDEAERLLLEALEGHRRKFGADHAGTLLCLNSLAALYWSRGRYDEAEPLFREALAGRRRVLGADHPDTLATLNSLALLSKLRGRYEEAEPLYEQVVAGCRRALGDDHPQTVASLTNLAMLHLSRRHYDKAEPLLREALAARRRTLKPDHPDTLRSLNNLAGLCLDRGQYDEAESLFQEALAGRRMLRADHPDMFQSLNNLGRVYHVRGRFEKAEPLYREALEGRRRVLGADHPATLRSLNNLGTLYRDSGRYDKAEPLLLEAVAGAKKKFGPDHDSTLTFIENTAQMYDRAGKPESATPLWRELTEAAKRQAGPGSPAYADRLVALSENLLKRSKPAEAEPLLRECLEIRRKKEPDAWVTFNTQSLLGQALLDGRKYAEAEPLLTHGYEGMAAREGMIPTPAKARLTEALERVVQLYDVWGRSREAAEWRRKLEEAKPLVKGAAK